DATLGRQAGSPRGDARRWDAAARLGDAGAATAALARTRLSQCRRRTVLRYRDRRWGAPREPRARAVRAPGGLIHAGTARSVSRCDAARARRSAVFAAGRAGHPG